MTGDILPFLMWMGGNEGWISAEIGTDSLAGG